MRRVYYFIQVYYTYLAYIFYYLLNKKSLNKKALSGGCLINKPEGSFRIVGTEHKSKLVIIKYAYRILLKWRKGDYKPHFEESNGIALYDEAADWVPRMDFIASVYEKRPGIYIDKEQISRSEISNIVFIIKSMLLALMVLPLMPFSFSKNRAQVALLLYEIDELSQLLYYVKIMNISTVIYSCIFEKDSNAAANLLMKRGIKIIKNPSEDPLYFHNQILIADEVGLCNAYQREELTAYAETIFVTKAHHWYPENHLLHLKGKTFCEPEKGVIGYYSGSSWLRIELKYNLTVHAYNPYKAEEELEKYIKNFCYSNPQYKLRVFLHPLEKKHIELTRKHFATVWPDVNFEFENLDKHTTDTFHRCEVALTVFSGVMFYRFYAGYKGLMYCPYMPDFPIPNTVLSTVSAATESELNSKLLSALNTSNQDFAQVNLQGKYTYGA